MELKDFKNRHDGERAFLIGNGPSLSATPLCLLQNEYTFGVNSISFIYEDTPWRPSYYVYGSGTDYTKKKFESYMKTVNLGIPCFISNDNREFFGEKHNIHYYTKKDIGVDNVSKGTEIRKKAIKNEEISSLWSEDIKQYIYRTSGILYVTAQIASYMGFDKLYLLGCDLYKPLQHHVIFENGEDPNEFNFTHRSTLRNLLDFLSNSEHKSKSLINLGVYKMLQSTLGQNIFMRVTDPEINYFSEDYFRTELNRTYTDFRNYRKSQGHELIEIAGDKYGFNVLNATIGGQLDVHDRVSLLSLVP